MRQVCRDVPALFLDLLAHLPLKICLFNSIALMWTRL